MDDAAAGLISCRLMVLYVLYTTFFVKQNQSFRTDQISQGGRYGFGYIFMN